MSLTICRRPWLTWDRNLKTNKTFAVISSSRRFWEASAVIWTAVVLSLAITPIRNIELITAPISDKVLHAAAFLIGSIVWAGALDDMSSHMRSLVTAGVICLAMGGLIEVLQTQTSTRKAETGDIVADAAGILIGGVVWLLISRRRDRQRLTHNPVEDTVGL